MSSGPRPLDLAIAIALVGAAFALHGRVLGLWWSFDDPYLLECAIFSSPLEFLWNAEVYQRLSTTNFTPAVIVSYWLDHALFGLEPAGFYTHQVLALGVVAGGIFLVVRPWSRPAGVVAGLAFLLSGPTTLAAQTLMFRHYVEGAGWALLCVLLLRSAGRSGWRPWLAGLAYLGACLSKEVYVPLAVLAPFLLAGDWGVRARRCLPMWGLLGGYVVLRLVMLPTVAGDRVLGGEQLADPEWWRDGLQGILAILLGRPDGLPLGLEVAAAAVVFGVVATLLLAREAGLALRVALFGGAGLATVVPLWTQLQQPAFFHGYRLAIHLAVLAAVGFGLLLAARRRVEEDEVAPPPHGWAALARLVLGVVVLGFAFWGQGDLSRRQLDENRGRTEELKFLWSEPADKVLVAHQSVNYWESVRRIRRERLGQDTPLVCGWGLDLRGVADARYLIWNDGAFTDVTPAFRQAREQLLARRVDKPFTVEIRVERGRMHFDLDKDEPKASYFFLRGGEPGIYEQFTTPPSSAVGSYLTAHPHYLRAMKVFEDGTFALSPEWTIDLGEDASFRWPE